MAIGTPTSLPSQPPTTTSKSLKRLAKPSKSINPEIALDDIICYTKIITLDWPVADTLMT